MEEYNYKSPKQKIEEILNSEDIVESINENINTLLEIIPEINYMIGFEHRHPHHHLDVWEHTLAVLNNLNTNDLEIKIAALLHDIGKPFSYQDDEVRHFHGHAEVSYEMAQKILTRLTYDKKTIKRVCYLVRTHDTVIDVDNLDNTLEMVKKRLQLQYADARGHRPDKVNKRIIFLDNIKKQIIELESERTLGT